MHTCTFSTGGGWLRKVVPLAVLFFCTLWFMGCRSSQVTDIAPEMLPAAFHELISDTLSISQIASGFVELTDISISSSGTMYVVDAGRHHVIRLNNEAQRLDSIGGRGTGSVQFDRPVYLDAGNELKIYVADSGNRRITMFDRRWQHLGHLELRDDTYEPGPMVQSPSGELIFWDIQAQRLRRIRPDAQSDTFFNPDVTDIRFGVSSLILNNDVLYVVEGRTGLLHRFSINGRKLGHLNIGTALRDVQVFGSELLLLTADALLVMRQSGEVRDVWPLPTEYDIHRIGVHQQSLYLIASDRILRANMP